LNHNPPHLCHRVVKITGVSYRRPASAHFSLQLLIKLFYYHFYLQSYFNVINSIIIEDHLRERYRNHTLLLLLPEIIQ
jgi:hypothetical protein